MSVADVVRHLRGTVRRHGVAAGTRALALTAVRSQLEFERVWILELGERPEGAPRTGGSAQMAAPAQVARLAADDAWDMPALDACRVDQLYAGGYRCLLNVVGDEVAGYAWLNPRRLVIPKLRLAIPLRADEVHIFKGFTHPRFRGQRLGEDRFAYWWDHLVAPHGKRVYSDFSIDNPATWARASRSGLRPVGCGTYVAWRDFVRRRFAGAIADRPWEAVAKDLPHWEH